MATRPPKRYPLSSWRLGGFRSIKDSTTFELGGLNILVGANSAGKSSVLHSLLMVAQTLANPLVDRPLVLNGHLVRLGLADDIIHETKEVGLHIGFDLIPTVDFAAPGVQRLDFDRLTVSANFVPTTANDFEVSETQVTSISNDEEEALAMRRRDRVEARQAFTDAGLATQLIGRWVETNLLAVEGTVPERCVGVQRRQFLPAEIWRIVNTYERELELLRWAVTRYQLESGGTVRHPLPVFNISSPTREFFRSYIEDTLGSDAAASVPAEGSLTTDQFVPQLSEDVLAALGAFVGSPWYMQHKQGMPFEGAGESAGLPGSITAGLDYARRWFAENLLHIGPLRAAPQPLYELPLAASATSVGRNGEFTAAVLSAHAKRRVLSPDPGGGPTRQKPLSDAVNEWVSAMDLLSSVHSKDRGKLGYELHLVIEGVSRDLDLTTVGVGVSQALPIIVLGLLAQPGSLLLFEQPELHLHPDVQASLGDFFLALAGTGRQLIVETHSEYLVNRLRRRAAADPDSDVPEQTRLFFFERQGSSSSVQAARIGPGGLMSGWPRGFLDTASREIEAIALSVRPGSEL
jgi:predicted ATPase